MKTVDIIGGGVAGLALAGAIHPDRMHIRLYEPGSGGHRLGTLFGMWPEALRSLERIGLADRVREAGIQPAGAVFASASGRTLARVPAPRGTTMTPRPALLQLLTERVGPHVEVRAERVTDLQTLDGDLLVGADGAYSVVRSNIWGNGPRDTGTIALRGVAGGSIGDLGLDVPHEWWGRGSLFGVSPTVDGINWYSSMRTFECTPQEGLAWAREHFSRFPAPVREVLDRATAEATLVNHIVEAPFTASLVRGRHVLVGDAAHAISPNLGRGACESLVDAVTLAELLSTCPIDEALRQYDRRRRWAGQAAKVGSMLARRAAFAWR